MYPVFLYCSKMIKSTKKALFCFAFLALAAPIFIFGQNRKTITRHFEVRKIKIKEVYEVLGNTDSTKDGSYKYYRNNKLVTQGYYSAGKMDSTWATYGNSLLATRQYDHGVGAGEWVFYTNAGEREWSYSFASGKIWMPEEALRKFSDTVTYYYQDESEQWKRDKMDVNPVPLYGVAEYFSYLSANLYYPQDAQDNEEQGVVQVAIAVDENGKAFDWSIAKSPAASLSAVALEVVKGFYHEFIPAEKNGRKVKCIYYKPVSFKLEVAR